MVFSYRAIPVDHDNTGMGGLCSCIIHPLNRETRRVLVSSCEFSSGWEAEMRNAHRRSGMCSTGKCSGPCVHPHLYTYEYEGFLSFDQVVDAWMEMRWRYSLGSPSRQPSSRRCRPVTTLMGASLTPASCTLVPMSFVIMQALMSGDRGLFRQWRKGLSS